MADFDAKLPVRALAPDFTTEVADSTGTTINPTEEFAQGSTTSGQKGGLSQGATTTSAPTYADGTTNPLSLDANGNLRVTVSAGGTQAVVGGETIESTAAWDSTTVTDTALTQSINMFNTILVTLNQGSTITGGVVTFELSDTAGFTHAYPVKAATIDGFVVGSTYTLTASTNQAFVVNVAAAAAFRVRLSTPISGTGTVNVGIQANGMATEPSVTVGGTVSATQGTSPWVDNLTQVGGSAISLGQKTSANSLPVVVASDQSAIPVTLTPLTGHVPDYKHVSSLASAGADTHTFTPAGTINFDGVAASASGEIKVQVQWGPTGTPVEYWTGFTSAANKYITFSLPYPISIPNTSSILVIVTNMDTQAQDVYSSILYH